MSKITKHDSKLEKWHPKLEKWHPKLEKWLETIICAPLATLPYTIYMVKKL